MEDYVQFTIHPESSDGLLNLRMKYLTWLSTYTLSYVWHEDAFNISEPSPGLTYLSGKMTISHNVEDLWFTVGMLIELSRFDEGAVIRVTDQDGETLLIETADELPKWAQDPEISDKRCYIHQGQMHLIPLASNPSNLTPHAGCGQIDVESAVKTVRRYPDITLCSERIQKKLKDRVGSYPRDWQHFQHYSHYLVPKKVAKLMRRRNDLIPKAIKSFYTMDQQDMRSLRTMKNFQPASDGLVKIGLTLSKCLFAMLKSKHFKPDRRSGFHIPPEGEEVAYDLGTKLTCGFEILVSQKSSSSGPKSTKNMKLSEFMKSLVKNNYFEGELEGSKKYQELYNKAKNYASCLYQEDEDLRSVLENIPEDSDQDQSLERKPDDESWLCQDPESFDKLLASHFKTSAEIPQELSKFMTHTSGLEGVEFDEPLNFDPDHLEDALTKVLGLDSDSEGDGDEGIEEDDVEDQVKEELKESKVFEDEDKPLDINAKVLKNLLKSFEGQDGMPGPASTLLNPMGINLNL